jgi:hypothetical protein
MQAFGDGELGRAAGRIWTEGRVNPIDWEIRTPLGTFTTDNRSVWRTDNDLNRRAAPVQERASLVPGRLRRRCVSRPLRRNWLAHRHGTEADSPPAVLPTAAGGVIRPDR